MAALLGHDGLVVNSCDAGEFARDHLEEALACLALLMSNLGRLATDLYVWHSWEFSFVQVADGLAGTSSIMPQKKNPHSLERVKALAGQAAGWLPAMMSCQRSVLSTDLDATFGDDLVTPAVEAASGACGCSPRAFATLNVDRAVMAAAGRGVLEHHQPPGRRAGPPLRPVVPHRPPHRRPLRAGLDRAPATGRPRPRPSCSTWPRTRRSAARSSVSATDLRAMLDARRFLDTRLSEGGVAPDTGAGARGGRWAGRCPTHERWRAAEASRIEQAIAELGRVARTLAARAGA